MPWAPPRRDSTRARRAASSRRGLVARRGRAREGEQAQRQPIAAGAEPPREPVVADAIGEEAGRERTGRGHRPGQREEQPGEARRMLAAEEVGDGRGEERGGGPVGEAEDDGGRVETRRGRGTTRSPRRRTGRPRPRGWRGS